MTPTSSQSPADRLPQPAPARPSGWRRLLAIGGAVLGAAYLVYPSAGVFELLPDPIPFVGSFDEVAATALLLYCLDYLGIPLPLRGRRGLPTSQERS